MKKLMVIKNKNLKNKVMAILIGNEIPVVEEDWKGIPYIRIKGRPGKLYNVSMNDISIPEVSDDKVPIDFEDGKYKYDSVTEQVTKI